MVGEDKKKEVAEKFIRNLSALKKYDLFLLLRSIQIVGGIVLDVDKKETHYGDRVVYKVMRPDGRIAYEYADRMIGGTIQSCTFRFKDYPIVLTERKVPTMMDDPKVFYPIIFGLESQMWGELVADLNIKHQIIHHQASLIYSLNTKTEMLESKLSSMGSELRQLKEENELLRRENTELKIAISQIRKIAETAIRENMTKDMIIDKIMKTIDQMSTKVVQMPEEIVEDITNMLVRTKSKIEIATSGNGELESLRSDLAKIRELEEEIKSIKRTISDIPNIIKEVLKKEHG